MLCRLRGSSLRIAASSRHGTARQALCSLSKQPAARQLAPASARLCATLAQPVAAPLAEPVVSKAVGWWLMGCSTGVFGMVILGGITRLTRSGLSMTDWRPQGSLPPLNHEEWEAEFAKYRRFPEFQRLHPDMSLDEFKDIFWLEWSHRMAGRAIGVVFGVPLLVFASRGMIPRSLAPTLGLLFAMGGSQGLVGWWMVKSGLEQPPADLDGVPRVSPYRLAAHLTAAFAIYSGLLYTALGVLQPRLGSASQIAAALRPLRARALALAGLVGVTAISGAFVAGMQAGLAFNTFPLMEGRLVPEGYFELTPAYRNFFESVPSVQLHHRALALSTLGATSAFWLYVHRRPVPAAISRCTDLLLACAVGQVSLGVATLLNAVPVWLGSAHQAGALTLFSVTLLLLHTFRRPHDLARTVARFGAARGPSTWVRAQPKVA